MYKEDWSGHKVWMNLEGSVMIEKGHIVGHWYYSFLINSLSSPFSIYASFALCLGSIEGVFTTCTAGL